MYILGPLANLYIALLGAWLGWDFDWLVLEGKLEFGGSAPSNILLRLRKMQHH